MSNIHYRFYCKFLDNSVDKTVSSEKIYFLVLWLIIIKMTQQNKSNFANIIAMIYNNKNLLYFFNITTIRLVL
jgi:quinol-cytochrome oxidoreductase complex cytochrome b subunit